MKKITVLLFANLREKAGTARIELELQDEVKVRDVKEVLIERFPAIQGQLKKILISINQEIALESDPVPDGAEIAFMPPVSGGAESLPTVARIVDQAFRHDEIIKEITTEETGAVCTFTGVVRKKTARGKPYETSHLEYEAYQPMAEGKMLEIAAEIRLHFPEVKGIAIIQRIGKLEAGTPTVIISCASTHRDSGVFEAARYGIDRLKEIVPVWKKEVRPDGEIWVEGDHNEKY